MPVIAKPKAAAEAATTHAMVIFGKWPSRALKRQKADREHPKDADD